MFSVFNIPNCISLLYNLKCQYFWLKDILFIMKAALTLGMINVFDLYLGIFSVLSVFINKHLSCYRETLQEFWNNFLTALIDKFCFFHQILKLSYKLIANHIRIFSYETTVAFMTPSMTYFKYKPGKSVRFTLLLTKFIYIYTCLRLAHHVYYFKNQNFKAKINLLNVLIIKSNVNILYV